MAQDLLQADINAALERGDFSAARDLLDLQVAANPTDREARYAAARLSRSLGDREGAIERYRACLDFDPNDQIATFGLSVLGQRPPPERVPDAILKYVFDRNANIYEASMASLGYSTPDVLADMLASLKGQSMAAALDIGCGTGLNGSKLRPLVHRLVGIDISEPMLASARSKKLYDQLVRADISSWLAACTESFNLVSATNVLMYFGNLAPVFVDIARVMGPGGLLAFDLETLPANSSEDYVLGVGSNSGRYAHSPSHAAQSLAATGFQIIGERRGTMRMELNQPVEGLFIVARKA